MSRRARRQFVKAHANVRNASILEIGALDHPTFPDRDCRYLDWFSYEELLGAINAKNRRDTDTLVKPDYVVKQKLFAELVPDRFDVVIANHVIEHIADPLTWLQQVRVVAPEGRLFLTIPDKRYTFDYLRPLSSAGALLRAQAEDLERPTSWHRLDALFYHRPLTGPNVWAGNLGGLAKARFTVEQALEHAKLAETEYVDTHCNVFSADTFASLLNDLSGITGWKVRTVEPVAESDNEFYAELR